MYFYVYILKIASCYFEVYEHVSVEKIKLSADRMICWLYIDWSKNEEYRFGISARDCV